MSSMPRVRLERDQEVLQEASLERDLLIGRSQHCDMQADDRAISREHFVLRPTPQGIELIKKTSYGDLKVNGQISQDALLKLSDLLSFGPFTVRFVSDEMPAEAAPPQPERTPIPQPSIGLDPTTILPQTNEIELSESPSESVEVASPESPPPPTLEVTSQQVNPISVELPPQVTIPEPEYTGTRLEHTKTAAALEMKSVMVLQFEPGVTDQEVYRFTKNEIVLGRDESCDVVLRDEQASRQNTEIRRSGIKFFIKDLGSSNGTRVNGVLVEEQELFAEDKVQVGEAEFLFRVRSSRYEAEEQKWEAQSAPQSEGSPLELPPPPSFDSFSAPPPETGWRGYVERYRAVPPQKRRIYLIFLLIVVYFLFDEDDTAGVSVRKRVKPKPSPQSTEVVRVQKLSQLNKSQKKFIEDQYQIAFEYYKNRDYDRSLFELDKIFSVIPEYKDAREIERYAREGKRKLDAIEEERKRKEAEEEVRKKVAWLVEKVSLLMQKKKYEEASTMFVDILTLDPENPSVPSWKTQIEAFEEEQKLLKEQQEVERKLNEEGFKILKDAQLASLQKNYQQAIEHFQRILDLGISQEALKQKAHQGIKRTQKDKERQIRPLMKKGLRREKRGQFQRSIKAFEQVLLIEPKRPEALVAIARVRSKIEARSRKIYLEGVISESYSDYQGAEERFLTCMKTSVPEDPYYQRCYRKLHRYWDVPVPNNVRPIMEAPRDLEAEGIEITPEGQPKIETKP